MIMMNKVDIKNMFGQIETPEYDPTDDIKQKINQGYKIKPQMSRIKRLVIISALITVALILMSAGIVIYHKMVFYDMDGNKKIIKKPSDWNERGREEFEFEQAICDNMEEYEILFIHSPSSTSRYVLPIKIYDYGELINYLQNNGGEQLSLPEYIPQGFEFEHADVYVDPTSLNVSYEEFEPVYYEEKFGNIYEKYILPGNQITTDSVYLYYYKDKDYISCSMRFIWNGISGYGSTFDTNIAPEKLDMAQFEKSIILSHKIGSINSIPYWKFISVKPIDKPINFLNVFYISKIWREANVEHYAFNLKYNEITYDIDSMSVSREEIIKMAESIK